MTTGPTLLFSGTLAARETFTTVGSSLLHAIHWKTLIWHYTHVLIISEFKGAQPTVFYGDTISRKVRHSYPPPDANPVLQYHGIIIIIIIILNIIIITIIIIIIWMYQVLI